MRKLVFRILTIIIAANAAVVSSAQTGNRVNEVIGARFREYCSQVPWEEVWIHTDRDTYISGEPIWLAAYLFDRESNNLPNGSSTVYIELINSSSMPVIQRKISLVNGCGDGSFILPDTLSTGRYLLRAYTNWMKNFLPVNCFMKEVDIYNPFNNRILRGIAGTGVEAKSGKSIGSAAGKAFSFSLERKPDTLVISIASDESFRLGNGSTCYLFIQTHGKININEPVKLYGSSARITIPVRQLSEGINHITLFSAAGEPIYERLIYTPVKESSPILADVPSKTGKRSKFSLAIDPGKSSIARMSISIAASDGLAGKSGLTDYMVFGSEYGQQPPSLSGKSLKTIPDNVIDDFLVSAKSNWIDWTKILSGKFPDLKYRRENDYQNLSGLLVNRETMKPDSGYVLLSKPGKTAWFQYSETDGNGRFSFDIPSALAGSDIVIQPSDNHRKDIIRMDSQFPSIYFSADKRNNDLTAMPWFINDWSVNYQASRIYGVAQIGDSIKQSVSEESLPRFYGKPDLSLIMENYIKLPVMQEVFFELIPGVYLKSKKSVWEITMADPVDFSIYTTPPILMIDGVVVHDAALIANLDPELVERIEIVRDRYMIGDYLMYGMVNVITRVGKFTCVELPDQAIRIAWRKEGAGYSFPEPVLKDDEKTRHIPDLRNTLYWNPSLKADKNNKYNVELRSSDFASHYIISIQGVSDNGKSFSIEKVINIGK
jgi:hypothetical protein